MFLPHIHALRGLAILFIVASHCFALFDWSDATWTYRWLDVLTTNGTVMFVFISGFLFQHLSGRFAYGKYLRTKFNYVILPYLIVSIPAIALRMARRGEVGGLTADWYDRTDPVVQVLWFLATGAHLGPLWFIPVIALIYLVAPLLVRFDRTPGSYWLLPVLLLAGSFLHRPWANADPLHAFLHLLPAYMLGMFFSRHRDAIQEALAPRLPLLAGLWAVAVVVHALSGAATGIVYVRDWVGPLSWQVEWTYFQKLLLMAVLVTAWQLPALRPPSRWFDDLAIYSFSVYFLHGYATLLLANLLEWRGVVLPGTALGFGICVASVTIACILAAKGLKLVTGPRSRLLVGS